MKRWGSSGRWTGRRGGKPPATADSPRPTGLFTGLPHIHIGKIPLSGVRPVRQLSERPGGGAIARFDGSTGTGYDSSDISLSDQGSREVIHGGRSRARRRRRLQRGGGG